MKRTTSGIYLDHAATTPLLPEVQEIMRSASIEFGNPSSLHRHGRQSKQIIDQARESLSESLHCLFAEAIFTGSGSESANMAILGAAVANEDARRKRVFLGSGEHHCVLHTEAFLAKLGYEVIKIPILADSCLDIDWLEKNLDDSVLLVSAMHANNETGRIQPISDVRILTTKQGTLFHCDMVQTFLKPVGENPVSLGADLVTVAGHKINGPKGVGALYIRGGTKIKPLIAGGGQERELRAGTENIPAIAGFGEAIRRHKDPLLLHVKEVRDTFLAGIASVNPVRTVAPTESRILNGHVHVRFPGIDAETLLIRLDREGISASSGAACSSGSIEPSHVLLACGFSEDESKEGLRFTFGLGNTLDEAQLAAEVVVDVVTNVREHRARR